MKILKVISILDKSLGGGCAERVSQISKVLIKNNDEVSIVTLNIGVIDSNFYSKYGISISKIDCILTRFFIPSIFNFKKYSDFDLIYLYSHWSILNVVFFFIGRYYKIPIIFCPVGTSIIFGRSFFLKYLYNKIIGIKIITKSQAIVAVNDEEKKFINNYYCYKGPIYIIPNGVDEVAFKVSGTELFRSKYLYDSTPYIIFIGRINYIKGPDLLLEAFNRISDKYPNFNLVIVGPDEGMAIQLKSYAKLNNIQNKVIFTGYIDGDYKRSALQGASLLVIPSRKEAMSIVVLEAAAQMCPVLITDNCGFPAVQNHGGLIIPADISHIQNGIDNALSDPVLLKIMGRKLHHFVLSNYSWNQIADQFIGLNKEVVDGRK